MSRARGVRFATPETSVDVDPSTPITRRSWTSRPGMNFSEAFTDWLLQIDVRRMTIPQRKKIWNCTIGSDQEVRRNWHYPCPPYSLEDADNSNRLLPTFTYQFHRHDDSSYMFCNLTFSSTIKSDPTTGNIIIHSLDAFSKIADTANHFRQAQGWPLIDAPCDSFRTLQCDEDVADDEFNDEDDQYSESDYEDDDDAESVEEDDDEDAESEDYSESESELSESDDSESTVEYSRNSLRPRHSRFSLGSPSESGLARRRRSRYLRDSASSLGSPAESSPRSAFTARLRRAGYYSPSPIGSPASGFSLGSAYRSPRSRRSRHPYDSPSPVGSAAGSDISMSAYRSPRSRRSRHPYDTPSPIGSPAGSEMSLESAHTVRHSSGIPYSRDPPISIGSSTDSDSESPLQRFRREAERFLRFLDSPSSESGYLFDSRSGRSRRTLDSLLSDGNLSSRRPRYYTDLSTPSVQAYSPEMSSRARRHTSGTVSRTPSRRDLTDDYRRLRRSRSPTHVSSSYRSRSPRYHSPTGSYRMTDDYSPYRRLRTSTHRSSHGHRFPRYYSDEYEDYHLDIPGVERYVPTSPTISIGGYTSSSRRNVTPIDSPSAYSAAWESRRARLRRSIQNRFSRLYG